MICQKPMAPTLEIAEQMVATCRQAGVWLFIHENWRWQGPIRQLKRVLADGEIGKPFRARIDYCNDFPVFDNQPFLEELEQFMLTDMGSHILDVARFLFGEARSLYCQTHRIHQGIKGEDVATVMMTMEDDVTVVCKLSYATRTERDVFPQTFISVEGDRGSAALEEDYAIRTVSETGVSHRRCPPPHYFWADPAYDLIHSSIVPCNENLLAGLRGEGTAETTGEDNLRTVRLIFAAYESARTGGVVAL